MKLSSHFVLGVLSAHCADETDHDGDNCTLKEGDQVKFKDDYFLYKTFLEQRGVNLNEILIDWKVLKVIEY
jgi:hypothetical protein